MNLASKICGLVVGIALGIWIVENLGIADDCMVSEPVSGDLQCLLCEPADSGPGDYFNCEWDPMPPKLQCVVSTSYTTNCWMSPAPCPGVKVYYSHPSFYEEYEVGIGQYCENEFPEILYPQVMEDAEPSPCL